MDTFLHPVLPFRPQPCWSLKKTSMSAKKPGDILTAQGGNGVRVGLAFGGFFPSVKVKPTPDKSLSFSVSRSGETSSPLSPPPSLPCPITTSFHRGLGRPPRSAPDTSTKHTSNQMPPTGVSAPLFWVVSHPFTLCPLLGPVGLPGGPRHPSSSLGFHAEKGSLCNHICKVSFWAACIDQGLSWEMNGPPESG